MTELVLRGIGTLADARKWLYTPWTLVLLIPLLVLVMGFALTWWSTHP